MTLTHEREANLLKISGTVGILQAKDLQNELLRCLADVSELNVDLAALSTCDTAALQVFLSAQKTAAARGVPLRFVGLSDAVMDLLATLGLAFDVCYECPSALEFS